MTYISCIVLMMSFSLSAISARGQFAKCDNTQVKRKHGYAVEYISNTVKMINSNVTDDRIEGALNFYFKLSLYRKSDHDMIKKVFKNIKIVNTNAADSKYKCHERKNTVWCAAKINAIVPPPKKRIHLCPNFFNKLRVRGQIGTIIHEWFHLWGKKNINYLPETYCFERKNLPAKKLIRNADQYMLFIYYIGSGGHALRCF